MYLRVTDGITVTSSLVYSKTRLSPRAKKAAKSDARVEISIPRLELLALLIGTRAAHFVCQELHRAISCITVWSDSKCALHWISSTKQLSVFVDNRVREIKTLEGARFRYVPGGSNPADLPSRGVSLESLSTASLWWSGPAWLSQPEENWPPQEFVVSPSDQESISQEERKQPLSLTSTLVANDQECPHPSPLNSIMERFSSLKSVVKSTMLVFKFLAVRVWSRVSGTSQENISKRHPLFGKMMITLSSDQGTTALPQRLALSYLVRTVQQSQFQEVFSSLARGTKNSLCTNLGLQADGSGIL